MESNMPRQSTPIVVKPPKIAGLSSATVIQTFSSSFGITTQFGPSANDWSQSASAFSISYVESIVVGTNMMFCQTSSYAHPLTFAFKDEKNNDIFTITEVPDAKGKFKLNIGVAISSDYFTANVQAAAWNESTFSKTTPIKAIEAKDKNGVPVCRLNLTDDSYIYLNLEPT